jgi:hypothetical protein
MRLGLFWQPEQAAPLADALGDRDILLPLSQRAYAAGTNLRSSNVPRFWEVIRGLDLSVVEDAAAKAIARVVDSDALQTCIDRPAIWHNAREAAYVGLATRKAIAYYKPEQVFVLGNAPEAIAVQSESVSLGVDVTVLPHTPRYTTSEPPPEPPESLVTPSTDFSRSPGPWVIVLGTAMGDWGHNIPRLTRGSRKLALLIDAKDSGELSALYAFCSRRADVRLVPLWRETTLQFLERGDNREYAKQIGRVVDNVLKAKPVLGVVSDLRRAETVVTLRKLNQANVPPLILVHSGAAMADPYRFHAKERGDAKIEAWTTSAALDYGNAIVAAPRRIRTTLPKRMVRLIGRGTVLRPRPRIGVVVTTAALFATPEYDLAELLDSFARLVAGSETHEATVMVRLRSHEDCESVWNLATAGGDNIDFEYSDSRPAIAFVRDADVIIEVGSETTMFLEAAGNFVPYMRMGTSSRLGRRFKRDERIVPSLEAAEPWRDLGPLAKSRRKRLILSLRQHRWLMKETMPAS